MIARKTVSREEVQARLEQAYLTLDIFAEVGRHSSTRLTPARNGRRANGACPFCGLGNDRFVVWAELSNRGKHYFCNQCRKTGTILDLVQQIRGLTFTNACEELGIPNPYHEDQQGQPAPVTHQPRRQVLTKVSPDLEILELFYPRMRLALQKYERARAYLAERAIPLEIAAELGLGYIPPVEDMNNITPELKKISKWFDRVVFPLETPDGKRGFIGRALALWSPGMDENAHKKVLEGAGINRWEKTSPAGYFNWHAIREAEQVVFVEGLFDGLALLAGGVQDVIALGGTSLNVSEIPKTLESAIIAMDADASGKSAARSLYKAMYRAGYEVVSCAPVLGKDWSEAYRLHGHEGIAPILSAATSPAPDLTTSPVLPPDDHDLAEPGAAIIVPTVCADCGADMETIDPDQDGRDFFYWPVSDQEVICYCTNCRDSETGYPYTHKSLHQFGAVISRMVDELGGPGNVTITKHEPGQDKPGERVTLSDCAQDRPPTRCERCEKRDFHVNLAGTGWVCLDCGMVHRFSLHAATITPVMPVRATSADFWSQVKEKVERPPVDRYGKPYYTPEAWREKLALLHAPPDPRLYAHFDDEYEGYCKLYRPAENL